MAVPAFETLQVVSYTQICEVRVATDQRNSKTMDWCICTIQGEGISLELIYRIENCTILRVMLIIS